MGWLLGALPIRPVCQGARRVGVTAGAAGGDGILALDVTRGEDIATEPAMAVKGWVSVVQYRHQPVPPLSCEWCSTPLHPTSSFGLPKLRIQECLEG